jgi:hypothetical protein
LDLEDIFPSYILAAATRKPPTAPVSSQAPRGDPLSVLAAALKAVGANPAQAPAQTTSHYLGDPWGLVGVQVRTTEPNSEVVVKVDMDEVAEPTAVRFKLEAPGDYLLYPKLKSPKTHHGLTSFYKKRCKGGTSQPLLAISWAPPRQLAKLRPSTMN